MDRKRCIECTEPIYGRSDKKFCNDSCRNAYNNKLNSTNYNILRDINNHLRRNRRILQELLGEEKMTKVKRHKLMKFGYSFQYHTHNLTTAKGHDYTFCYEYGFLEIEEDLFLIVKSKDKKEQQKEKNIAIEKNGEQEPH
ncbi:hypothetical protein ACS126_13505 [Sphingobacterium lactis]|uniref:hypothetical protein n=1 Tax=Sphingobacterium lactis TaxID=797291 RepID=UPI003EC6E137